MWDIQLQNMKCKTLSIHSVPTLSKPTKHSLQELVSRTRSSNSFDTKDYETTPGICESASDNIFLTLAVSVIDWSPFSMTNLHLYFVTSERCSPIMRSPSTNLMLKLLWRNFFSSPQSEDFSTSNWHCDCTVDIQPLAASMTLPCKIWGKFVTSFAVVVRGDKCVNLSKHFHILFTMLTLYLVKFVRFNAILLLLTLPR